MNKEKKSINTQWQSAITAYIDGLDENKHIQKYQEEVIAKRYQTVLLGAETQEDDTFIKAMKHIRGLKVTFRHVMVLQEYYDDFLAKKWLVADAMIAELKQADFYSIWINRALLLIDYITPATHVGKLTHSSSGAGSLVDSIADIKTGYITTSLLENSILDGAYPNASLSKIVKFLLLEQQGETLGHILRSGDISPLEKFSHSDIERHYWQTEFRKRLNPKPKADALAKQVYFPVDDDYHLLVVMKSSSLIQKIYDDYFHKDIRKQRDKCYKLVDAEKYSPDTFERIPNVTTLATVMSQPQNVSVLNGSRGGNIRLFSCAPPNWQSQLKPPTYRRSLFHDNKLNAMANESISSLKEMLVTFDTANISFKEPNRYRGIANWVSAIAEIVMDYAQIILSLPANWTDNVDCKLPIHHQYFLDAYRSDDVFVKAKKESEWQAELTKDFVAWLNGRLAGKQKNFVARKEHSRVWRRIFVDVLRRYQDDIDAMYIADTGVTA